MALQIDSVEPVYEDNYKKGYIGFTYQKTSVVSRGIAYITRWARISDVKVSHAFVVIAEGKCVEAVGTGVQVGDLAHYFDDPSCQVFFRKPVAYSENIAERICAVAKEQVGKAYDHSLIPAHFILGSIPGQWLNRMTFGALGWVIMTLFISDNEWICSELAAYSLDQQPEYHDLGILKDKNESIDPQELFEDEDIFIVWHNLTE